MSKIFTSLPRGRSAGRKGWRWAAVSVSRAAGLFNPQTDLSPAVWTDFQRVRPLLHRSVCVVCLSCWLCCSRRVLSWSLFYFLGVLKRWVLYRPQTFTEIILFFVFSHVSRLCVQHRAKTREPEDLTEVWEEQDVSDSCFVKCMFPVAWGRWEFEASSPNVHFFHLTNTLWKWVELRFLGFYFSCSAAIENVLIYRLPRTQTWLAVAVMM